MGDEYVLNNSISHNLTVQNSCHHYHPGPGFIMPDYNVCSLQFDNAEELAKHCMNHNENIGQECLICGQKFQEKNALRAHFISHDLQEILGLCINVKKTVQHRPPNYHLINHFCKLCGHVSNTVKTFNQHLSTHVPKLCYLCHVCDQTFVSSVYLEDHFKTHSSEEVYTIAYHTRHLQNNQIYIHNWLLEDMKSNPGEIDLYNSFYCHFCCSQIHQRKDIHIEKYHANFYNNIAHKCYICGGFFDSIELLRDHIRKYTSSSPSWPVVNREINESTKTTVSSLNQEPEFIEDSEPYSLKRAENEIRNILPESVSEPITTMSCQFCRKLFTRNLSLKYHLKICHSCSCGKCKKCMQAQQSNIFQGFAKSALDFTCFICNKNFPNKNQLQIHKSQHYVHPRAYRCNDCGETFRWTSTLMDHLRTKHPLKKCTCAEENDVCQACIMAQTKSYKCSYCHKIYNNKKGMKAHEKKHLGGAKEKERNYVCQICGKKYQNKSSLTTHLTTHEIKCRCGNCESCQKILDPKHQCEICKKIFLSNDKLKRHTIIHSGERPYVCEICGKGFNQNGNLLVHLRSHRRREKKS